MIPKVFHICWIGGGEYPPLIKYCLQTWKKVSPEYKIRLWDKSKFDINSVPWVKEAYNAHNYAAAADYIRFYALYNEGGIYLDSDVELIKSFDPLLNVKSFIGFEASTGHYEAAIIGAEQGTQWCKDILDYYDTLHFSKEKFTEDMFAPQVVERILRKRYPEIPSIPPKSSIVVNDDITVHPSKYFSPIRFDIGKSYSSDSNKRSNCIKSRNTYCIHRFTGSWTQKPSLWDRIGDIVRNILKMTFGDEKGDKIFKSIKFRK